MKTTQECWQALIDGEKLQHKNHKKGGFISLENGFVADQNGRRNIAFQFNFPDDWSIYTPPKWYENIPEGGVLCWAGNDYVGRTDIVFQYCKYGAFPFRGKEDGYHEATPLTKPEILQLLDNAPEGEGE